MSGQPPIDPRQFWPALGARAAGAAIVAARGSGGPAGFLALSVTHLCASPPTILVSIGKTTSALSAVRESGRFAVSYLSAEHRSLADTFSGMTAVKGADRFSDSEWDVLKTGAPVLRDAIGAVDCVLDELIERHETVIALGVVVGYFVRESGEPLVHFRGAYR